MKYRLQKRRWMVTAFIVIVLPLLIFRYSLLFAFQRVQLNRLGCTTESRLVEPEGFDQMDGCQKLWAHRVDSYERFIEVSKYFGGLEADIVFDTVINNFRVYHPPAPPSTVLLDSYFMLLDSLGKKVWLDTKELKEGEIEQAFHYFVQADKQYSLKKRIIIESSQMRFVNMLAREGFIVSFLVPVSLLETDERFDSTTEKLLPEVKFVSQEDIYIDSLKARFPGKKIITWALSFKNYFNLSHFKTLLADANISVILINIKSKGYK